MKIVHLRLGGTGCAAAGARRVLRGPARTGAARPEQDAVAVRVGETALELREAAGSPFYHVAFLVPGDRFDAALAWAREHVELLPDTETGEPVFDFTNWDAKAVYFHDPAGSIVELIAHRGIGETGATGRVLAGRAARPLRDRARLRPSFARRRARARARARGLGRHRRGRGAARLRRREGADADSLPGGPALAADGAARRGASGRGDALGSSDGTVLLGDGGRVSVTAS